MCWSRRRLQSNSVVSAAASTFAVNPTTSHSCSKRQQKVSLATFCTTGPCHKLATRWRPLVEPVLSSVHNHPFGVSGHQLVLVLATSLQLVVGPVLSCVHNQPLELLVTNRSTNLNNFPGFTWNTEYLTLSKKLEYCRWHFDIVTEMWKTVFDNLL